MKHVRTARGYESLVVSHDGKPYTVSATPLEVSNEAAEAVKKAGDENGVAVLVLDSADADTAEDGTTVTATPDLSAGVSAVSGTGDPVTTPDTDTTTTSGRTARKAGN